MRNEAMSWHVVYRNTRQASQIMHASVMSQLTDKFLYTLARYHWLILLHSSHKRIHQRRTKCIGDVDDMKSRRSYAEAQFKKTRRWHVTISCQPDGGPPQPVRPWKSGRVHLAEGSFRITVFYGVRAGEQKVCEWGPKIWKIWWRSLTD